VKENVMVKKWPGSRQAVQEIFQFFGVSAPTMYDCNDFKVHCGYIGERRLELGVNSGDDDCLSMQFILEKEGDRGGEIRGEAIDNHGIRLHNCLKLEMKIVEHGRKEVFIYANGGEIRFNDQCGIHAEIR
jgi:hypothetical protein